MGPVVSDGFTGALADLFADGGPAEPADGLATLDEQTRAAYDAVTLRPARHGWRRTARPVQIEVAESDAFLTLFLGGRGTGKGFAITNALAEWATAQVGDWCAISPTLGDVRKILVEGPSGLLKALGDDLAEYNKSSLILYLTNGSRILLGSAERPERFRGLNLSGGIVDELASFPAHTVRELWDGALIPALRIGARPRLAIATTPKRSSPILRELFERATAGDTSVRLLRGSTFDNAANLSPAFLDEVRRRYEGTRRGREELHGELLADTPGALLTDASLDAGRVRGTQVPELERIAVALDPAVSAHEDSDMTGMVVLGIGGPPDGWVPPTSMMLASAKHLYVLQDATCRALPPEWARRALQLCDRWDADVLSVEVNQGGALVETTIRQLAAAEGRWVPPFLPVHASRGKQARAEPVALLAEQGRLHVVGTMAQWQTEWTTWVPGQTKDSPDRVDATTWAACALMPELGMKPLTAVRVLAG